MIYLSFTQQRFEAANMVALQQGLPALQCDGGEECEFTADDDSDCPGCNRPFRFGAKLWGCQISYEYDEWEYYCSPACASGINQPGSVTDFLERMGWTNWWLTRADEERPQWTLVERVGGSERPIAHEGSERWVLDNKQARLLAAVVDEMMMKSHRVA